MSTKGTGGGKSLYADTAKLLEIIMAFHHEKDYYELLNILLTKMMEFTNADGGTLYMVEDGMLHFRIMKTVSLGIAQGGRDKIDLPPIRLDENNIGNISAYAAIKNEFVCIDDVYDSTAFIFVGPKEYDKMTGYRTGSMLVFPLTTSAGVDEPSEVIGVIQLINAMDRETGLFKPFDDAPEEIDILRALANISANALANLIYAKEIRDLFYSFVRVMAKAIDERSPYTVNHTNHVARYCTDFTVYLGGRFPEGHAYHLDDNRREQLAMAALLHDVGKIITPLEIMDKPDRLGTELDRIRLRFAVKKEQTENSYLKREISEARYVEAKEELAKALELVQTANTAGFLDDGVIGQIEKLAAYTYTDEAGRSAPLLTPANLDALTVRKGTLTETERLIMQEHVSVTGRLLEQMKFNQAYREVPVWAKSHHEFLDGSGYPQNLKGSQIPTETCILSIMDIYDALVARDRPYKRALPPEQALGILTEMADAGQLHKELVHLFIESGAWQLAQSAEVL